MPPYAIFGLLFQKHQTDKWNSSKKSDHNRRPKRITFKLYFHLYPLYRLPYAFFVKETQNKYEIFRHEVLILPMTSGRQSAFVQAHCTYLVTISYPMQKTPWISIDIHGVSDITYVSFIWYQGQKVILFMLAWKSMTLGPAKHEKVARLGRISNVFRIAGARSA